MTHPLNIREREGFGLASVLVRKGKGELLAETLHESFAIELPRGPRRTSSGDLALVGMGPGAWLAAREGGGNAFAASLREAIGDLASVSDQSDGYTVLRLSGPKVRDALCKLVPLDLHARAFVVGDVASTVAAHIGATLWRLEDTADGSPVFEIATYRSYASSFWHALSTGAAEFGFSMPRDTLT